MNEDDGKSRKAMPVMSLISANRGPPTSELHSGRGEHRPI